MTRVAADETPLPLMPDPETTSRIPEQVGDEAVGALSIGSTTNIPELPGRWSIWSQSSESPGAHFCVPLDAEAKSSGFKYAVIRAVHPRGAAKPNLTLLRTDPVSPGRSE